MENRCAMTCGFCKITSTEPPTSANETCVDQAVNCENMTNFCYSPKYQPILRKQCAKTCVFCQTSNICADSAENCQKLQNLCFEDRFERTMRLRCPETCGLCTQFVKCNCD